MKTPTFIHNDLVLFLRNGILPAYGFMTVLFSCSIFFTPTSYREYAISAVLCMDTAAIGFFFAGGIILLEKNQNVFQALFSTPLGIAPFILGRVISLSLIVCVNAAILILVSGVPLPDMILKFSGTILANFFYCVCGIGVGFSARSLNGYFGLSLLLFLPLVMIGFLFRFIGWNSIFLLILPVEAQLYFSSNFFYSMHTISSTLLAGGSFLVWILLAFLVAYARIRIFQSGRSS